MKCEEFELIGLDAERGSSLGEVQRMAAREHASSCSRCAALQDSWNAARVPIREFALDTAMAQTPPRVEMRLRQEFRTRHVTFKVRRTAMVTAWALAAAALLVITVSWKNWRKNEPQQTANHTNSSSNGATTNPVTPAQSAADQQPDRADSETLMADSELGDFTLLPGALSADTADAAILRVRLQRSSLGSLGLPVNEERAAEWIQVDLLVGNDGLPQAVRLPQE